MSVTSPEYTEKVARRNAARDLMHYLLRLHWSAWNERERLAFILAYMRAPEIQSAKKQKDNNKKCADPRAHWLALWTL